MKNKFNAASIVYYTLYVCVFILLALRHSIAAVIVMFIAVILNIWLVRRSRMKAAAATRYKEQHPIQHKKRRK
jgi:heme O synthase-like polyprenyltransferase